MKPYRLNASALVLRREGAELRILLLQKLRADDAWQLPQGGIEAGEELEAAALRELREETGISGGTLLGRLGQSFDYDYPTGFERMPGYRGQHVEFVAILIPPGTEAVADGQEIVACRWVAPEELPAYIRRPPYLAVVKSLLGEAMTLLPRS